MTLDDLVRLFEERLQDRFFGKYAGVVTDVEDPLGVGRLRAKVPAVLGEEVDCGWALPCVPFGGGADRGMLFLPSVGDTVWIEFEAGDPSRPIWTGTFWGAPDSTGGGDDLGTESGAETPESSTGDVAGPGRSILKTAAGHELFVDDDGEVVLLANGNGKTMIRLNREGEVLITADTIKLGSEGVSEKLVLGDSFMQMFNAHTHPTGVGPSGPPSSPMTNAHLSTKVTTE